MKVARAIETTDPYDETKCALFRPDPTQSTRYVFIDLDQVGLCAKYDWKYQHDLYFALYRGEMITLNQFLAGASPTDRVICANNDELYLRKSNLRAVGKYFYVERALSHFIVQIDKATIRLGELDATRAAMIGDAIGARLFGRSARRNFPNKFYQLTDLIEDVATLHDVIDQVEIACSTMSKPPFDFNSLRDDKVDKIVRIDSGRSQFKQVTIHASQNAYSAYIVSSRDSPRLEVICALKQVLGVHMPMPISKDGKLVWERHKTDQVVPIDECVLAEKTELDSHLALHQLMAVSPIAPSKCIVRTCGMRGVGNRQVIVLPCALIKSRSTNKLAKHSKLAKKIVANWSVPSLISATKLIVRKSVAQLAESECNSLIRICNEIIKLHAAQK